MLRLTIGLLLLGAALSEPKNGWKDGQEYIYKIKSRTLASYDDVSRQYSGIIMEGQLQIQPNGQDSLRAKISQAEYSPIHTKLGSGWDIEIPRDQMSMQNFPLSDKPFEIKMKNGVVKDLIVDKSLPTWQVNVLKSIVGQLQVDTQGENAEKSKKNQLPEGKQPHAMYTTMEDSVGGKCEVVYDISPLPAHALQKKPELAPMPELSEDGDFISVMKSKNYSNCDQRVSYHFGFNGRNDWQPAGSNGRYLSRSSVSRIVLSGDVKEYTIQSSVTTNKVVVNPDQREDQHATIISVMELRLQKVNNVQNQMSAPSDPQSAGNLVYDYNNPFDNQSARQPSHPKMHLQKNKKGKEHWRDNEDSYEISSESLSEEDEREGDKMMESSHNPQLPLFNDGISIVSSNLANVVESVKSVAREIGNEMADYDTMPEKDTLEKFTILTRLVRMLNVNEIDQVQRELYEAPRSTSDLNPPSQEQKARRNTWVAFRDAVAQAGNSPALINIKKWVQEKKIVDDEAAMVIDSIAKSTRMPTPEYMENFLDMLKLKEVIDPPAVFDNAHQSFADLIRHAVVNKKSARNRYSVHAFGKSYGKNIHLLHTKYFPYMTAQLQDGFDRKDSIKIQVLISAIGRTGHPRMLSVFEPYLEGKKEATPYERLLMVMSMNRLAHSYPKTARSVLYKIYSNTEDHYEIRTVAVFLLMATNPPASMIQRMADFTNYDSSKQVNSAVKSSIESLAQLDKPEMQELADAAKAALPLLTPEIYGPQYSRAAFKSREDPLTACGYFLAAYYIGSDDSIIPKGVSFTMAPTRNGLKMPKIQMKGAVSKIQDLWDSLQKQLGMKTKTNGKAEEKKYSPENIAKMLGMNGEKPELLEGFVSINDAVGSWFYSYSDQQTGHTGEQLDNLLVDLPEKLRRLQRDLSKGVNFDETSITNNEITMSFPTETGYPLTFTLNAPQIFKVIGQSKAQFEADQENMSPVPTSATLNAKVHMIRGKKIQKRISFVTPFEQKEYVGGVDKNMQLHLPIKTEIKYNKNKQEAHLKIEPNDEESQFKIIQIKTEPFTSKHDILSLKPVSVDKNTRIISKDLMPPLQIESKDDKQILQFNWVVAENMFISGNESPLKGQMAMLGMNKMVRSITTMFSLNPLEDTEYQKYSVKLSPDSNMNVEMKISYDSSAKDSTNENRDSSNEENKTPRGKAPRLDANMSENERKQKFLREVAQNINAAESSVVDVSVRINGHLPASATFTAATANSPVDEKARTLMYATVGAPMIEDYFVSVGFESRSPHFMTMDYEETLKANTQHELDGEIKFGRKGYEDDAETLNLNGKVKQTEAQKNMIRQSPEAQECMKESAQSGNKLTAACQKSNERAAKINAGDFEITFEDGSQMKHLTMGMLGQAQLMTLGRLRNQFNKREKTEKNKIKLLFEVSPNEDTFDFSMISPAGNFTLPNVKLPQTTRKEFERMGSDMQKDSYENAMAPFTTCALDKSQVKTFDNHRYHMQLGKCWHVAMTPVLKKDYFRQDHEEISEDKHVTVMTRDNEDGQKDLRITMGEREIDLSSRGNGQIEAKVDGKMITLSKKPGYQENENGQVLLEIFQFPGKSVKIVSEKYDVEILYDGSRAMIKTGNKYRDSVRGLCGDNDNEPENDQKTPKGCLLEKPEEFVATYALINDEMCQGPARKNAEKAKQSECIDDNARPGNVISDKEAGRKTNRESSEEDRDSAEDVNCTERRTMVSRLDSEICFSVKPVRRCASGCQSTGKKNKNVAFHCVRKSGTSERIAQRVEKGANPDLTQKKVSRTESHMIPTGCKALN